MLMDSVLPLKGRDCQMDRNGRQTLHYLEEEHFKYKDMEMIRVNYGKHYVY